MTCPESLRSTGIDVFMSYYDFFKDNFENKPLIVEFLMANRRSNKNGAIIRANAVKKIFKDKQALYSALAYIAYGASKVKIAYKNKAYDLINDLDRSVLSFGSGENNEKS